MNIKDYYKNQCQPFQFFSNIQDYHEQYIKQKIYIYISRIASHLFD